MRCLSVWKKTMSLPELAFSLVFFSLLGLAYVKGYDFVKKHAPEHLVHFYLIMTAIRMMMVITVVAIYTLLISQSREDSIHFAAWFLILYGVMMVLTLIYKH